MSDHADVTWVQVATLDDLWEGDFIGVEVDGEEVIVMHLPGGELRCFQGMCPHQEILLADGKVDFEAGTITCSAHEWEFSMDDGRGLNPRDCRLFRYAVKKDGEAILVGVPNDRRLRRLRHKTEQDAQDKPMTTTATPKLVGPVIRGVDEDIIDAVIAASEQDNPDVEIVIEDRGGYVRIQADRNFRLTQKSMQAALGRPFRLAEIEPSLVSFGGRLESMDDEWVWTIHTQKIQGGHVHDRNDREAGCAQAEEDLEPVDRTPAALGVRGRHVQVPQSFPAGAGTVRAIRELVDQPVLSQASRRLETDAGRLGGLSRSPDLHLSPLYWRPEGS